GMVPELFVRERASQQGEDLLERPVEVALLRLRDGCRLAGQEQALHGVGEDGQEFFVNRRCRTVRMIEPGHASYFTTSARHRGITTEAIGRSARVLRSARVKKPQPPGRGGCREGPATLAAPDAAI